MHFDSVLFTCDKNVPRGQYNGDAAYTFPLLIPSHSPLPPPLQYHYSTVQYCTVPAPRSLLTSYSTVLYRTLLYPTLGPMHVTV